MKSLIKKLIRRCVVVEGIGDDSADYPIQKISYLGKNSNCEVIFPYGMHANLSNDSLPVLLSISGNSENKVVFGGSPQNRIRNLEQDEVVFFHPITKSKIYFKNNGDIDIESTANVNVSTTADVTINAANLNITGNVNITGDLDTDGNVSSTGTVTNNTVNIGSTHNHNYVAPEHENAVQPGVSGGPQ